MLVLCFQHLPRAELGAEDVKMDKALTLVLMVYKPVEEKARKGAFYLD